MEKYSMFMSGTVVKVSVASQMNDKFSAIPVKPRELFCGYPILVFTE